MFTLAEVMKFLAHKLARLGGSGLPLAFIGASLFDCCLIWHSRLLARNVPFY
jgi:hypothetical protein